MFSILILKGPDFEFVLDLDLEQADGDVLTTATLLEPCCLGYVAPPACEMLASTQLEMEVDAGAKAKPTAKGQKLAHKL